MRNKIISKAMICLLFIFYSECFSQNIVILVIDGARYTETFGSEGKYLHNIWEYLKPLGTIYTNYYNDGYTLTIPGCSSILSGSWQFLANDGTQRPYKPLLFEYLRKQKNIPADKIYVITGKTKLDVLSYSTDPDYGENYKATYLGKGSDDYAVITNLDSIMFREHPQFIFVDFPSVDVQGHAGNYDKYLSFISIDDYIIWQLWSKMQMDPFYAGNTIFIVTNDHGRHDDYHGGFRDHGDGCEGCRHIMLLAIGGPFKKDFINNDLHYQTEIVPTLCQFLSINMQDSNGNNLNSINEIANVEKNFLGNNYPNPFNQFTNIRFVFNSSEKAIISIYNTIGQKLLEFDLGILGKGEHIFNMDTKVLPSGIYCLQLKTSINSYYKKIILVK